MRYFIGPKVVDEKGRAILNRIIPGFPYVERFCPYCERLLDLENAIHLPGQEEVYKAVFMCHNTNCGAFDEEARKAYVKVYYSGNLAFRVFETTFLRVDWREQKQ